MALANVNCFNIIPNHTNIEKSIGRTAACSDLYSENEINISRASYLPFLYHKTKLWKHEPLSGDIAADNRGTFWEISQSVASNASPFDIFFISYKESLKKSHS